MRNIRAKIAMIFFLLSYFLIYGGMHYYVYARTRPAFDLSSRTRFFIFVFAVLMLYAPVIVRLSERAGFVAFARAAAFIGYTWMGVIFLWFCLTFAFDAYRFVLLMLGMVFRKDFSAFGIPLGLSFRVSLVISLAIMAYGFFEAADIRVKRVRVETKKLPPQAAFKIVQISDIHLGLIVEHKRLEKIVSLIKKEDPALIVSTGDFVDGEICGMKELAGLLSGLKPPLGKFGVMGNHEFYAGEENSRCFHEDAGFVLLRGESVEAGENLVIAGVDDPAAKIHGDSVEKNEEDVLQGVDRRKFVILLKHQPKVRERALSLFDLQLSGHVHGGQIFPFTVFTRLFYPIPAGKLVRKGNAHIYVSRGTGTWGPPARFLAPPEITVFELTAPSL